MPEPTPEPDLTRGQLRVVELVVNGLTDRKISTRLGVSESTLQRRIREASRLLGARSRVDLAVRAVSSGHVAVTQEEGP